MPAGKSRRHARGLMLTAEFQYHGAGGIAELDPGRAPGIESLEARWLLSSVTKTPFTINPATVASDITTGPDGALWFAEVGLGGAPNHVGRITVDGNYTELDVPAGVRPNQITSGPDGNLWFTDRLNNAVGRITPAGVVTEFPIPTADSRPEGIVAGPDGRLFFTESNPSKIGAITTDGTITEYNPPALNVGPLSIIDRGDGNLWYTGPNRSVLGFQSPDGTRSGDAPIPSRPFDLTVGPDGALWYTASFVGKIGRLPGFFDKPTEFNLPAGSAPDAIVSAPDNNLYFTDGGTNSIGRITTAGAATFLPNLGLISGPTAMTVGPDGNLWVTESGANKIDRINLFPDPQDLAARVAPDPVAGQAFSGEVATFRSTVADTNAAEFLSTVDWGDGTIPTPATITKGAAGVFYVSGNHTYAGATASGTPDLLKVTISRPDGSYPVSTTAPVTVHDRSGPTPTPTPAPTLSVNNVTLTEGNSGLKNFTFTVTRSGDTSGASTVHFASKDGTATGGSDYLARSGVITFAAGEIQATRTIQVKGDATVEANETFKFVLSSPTGANLARGTGVGTILNDDRAPALPRVSIGGFTAAESNSGLKAFTFQVLLDKPSAQTVTVKYTTADGTAKAGSDYNGESGTVTFAPGQTSRRVTVFVKGDTTKEPDENFFVKLSSPLNASLGVSRAQGLIQNDD